MSGVVGVISCTRPVGLFRMSLESVVFWLDASRGIPTSNATVAAVIRTGIVFIPCPFIKIYLWRRDRAIAFEVSTEIAAAVLNKSIEDKDGIPKRYLKSL